MKAATYRVGSLVATDHWFEVPLDHDDPKGSQISIFVRELAEATEEAAKRPVLLFLQGGPGFPGPRPTDAEGWIKKALRQYRVLLLDSRGTGLSTPVIDQTLARLKSAKEQANYLSHFRADSIVRDAEIVRQQLLGDQPWTVVGQSYGGFCIATYLSMAPRSLDATLTFGGVPPMGQAIEDVYRATYQRTLERNRAYFESFPEDSDRLKTLMAFLHENQVQMPGGGVLSPRRLQQLGLHLGFTAGFAQIHYLLEQAFVEGLGGPELSLSFLRQVDQYLPFETNPIYALLHEAIYCEGSASNWAAHRVREEFDMFAPDASDPLFTGEMIYPWMFEDYERLRPLAEAAHLLAEKSDWAPLYDASVLAKNEVPSAAALYWDDMYVDRDLVQRAAPQMGGLKLWITNEFVHDALRSSGETVFDTLNSMLARGASRSRGRSLR